MFVSRPNIENTKPTFASEFNFGYKNLVVGGCSFTYNNSYTDACTWPYYLRELGDFDTVYDCALPGAGNYHISHAVQWMLLNQDLDREQTLVIIMWSGNDRDDFICGTDFLSNYPMQYCYLPTVASAISGGEHSTAKGNTTINIGVKQIKTRQSRAIENFLYIDSLKTWLDQRGYRSVFLNYIDRQLPSRTTDFEIKPYLPLGCQQRLNDIFDHCQDPYSFCLKNNLLCEDDFHPSTDGHLTWTRNILIPLLKSLNI